MKININKNIAITEKSKPLIIAEISGNHNGRLENVMKLIDLAKKSGADMVKIQTYEPTDITLNNNYVIKSGIWKNINLWKLYKKAQTPFSWHNEIFKYAKKKKVTLFSTPFSIRAVDFLESFNVPIYKISSFEITDLNLIKKIASTGKPIILSTGLSAISEIKRAVQTINKLHNKVIILHCVSGYPTPIKEANIAMISKLKIIFPKNFIGLSDHTNSLESSFAAISLGAKIIEKHFKIKENSKTPDSEFSLGPKKFKELVDGCANTWNSVFGNKKKLSELKSKKFRRSIFVKAKIKKGQKFSNKNIVNLRPKIGICSSNYFDILKKKSNKNIEAGKALKWTDVK